MAQLGMVNMTREELHQLVWSEPMRTAAKSMGISDVALAKQCRKANVPVPPRGWWARKAAGKRVELEALPPLPFAMANYFPALERPLNSNVASAEPAEEEPSAPPTFRDLAEITLEFRAAVKAVRVPATISSPHPIVSRLLKQDESRRSSQTGSGYLSDYYGPKFTSQTQQRRLRILSSLFCELERLGCKVQGSTHAGERFSIKVGSHWTYILFGIEGGASTTPFHRGRSIGSRPDRECLRFDLVDHDDRTPPARTWRDAEKPMEQQATDIVCGIFLRVEEDARRWALWSHNDRAEQRVRAAQEAKLAAEKAEAERIARERAAEAARLKRLTDGADELERAARIRRYVAAVQTENAAKAERVSGDAIDVWAAWALAEADRIDPVRSGRFLEDLSSVIGVISDCSA